MTSASAATSFIPDHPLPYDDAAQGYLRGTFDTFSPFELFENLISLGKTGLMVAEGPEGQGAQYSLLEGNVSGAHCGHLHGAEALLDLLGWHGGSFEFRPGAEHAEPGFAFSASRVLMEGSRLNDELLRRQGSIPSPLARLALQPGGTCPPDSLGCGLSEVFWALARRPGSSLPELDQGVPLCTTKIRLALSQLFDTRVLAIRTPGGPPARMVIPVLAGEL
jgi:hypothetical protein